MTKKIEKALFITFLAVVVILLHLTYWQLSELEKEKVELQKIETELKNLK